MQILPGRWKIVRQDSVCNGWRAALVQPAPFFTPEEECPRARFVVDMWNKQRTTNVSAGFVQLEKGSLLPSSLVK